MPFSEWYKKGKRWTDIFHSYLSGRSFFPMSNNSRDMTEKLFPLKNENKDLFFLQYYRSGFFSDRKKEGEFRKKEGAV